MAAPYGFTRLAISDEYVNDFRSRKMRQAVLAATSQDVASIAARGLRDPDSLTHDEIRTVCASTLAQTGHANS